MTSEFTIAVHALVYLNHKGETLDSESLAINVCTNPARVRKVMAKLKKAGFVATKEGVRGGYSMAKDAAEITLCQIGDALNVDYIKASWKSGDPDMDCLVASGMAGIMDDIYGDLNQLCKEKLEQISIKDIDNQIFGRRENHEKV